MKHLLTSLVAFFAPSAALCAAEAAPAASAAAWGANAADAFTKALAQSGMLNGLPPAADLISTGGWVALGLGGALVALRIAKNIPGVVGMAAGSAEWLFRQFAPDKYKAADERRVVAEQGMERMIQIIEGMPANATVSELKAKISAKLPSEVNDAVKAYLAQIREPA